MEKNTLYWLWLKESCRLSPTDINALLEQYDSIEEIYNEKDFSHISFIKPSARRALSDKDLRRAEKILTKSEDKGITILTFDSISYPDSLRLIPNPPHVLYLRGEIMKWDRLLGIAVVGTRRFTKYGHDVTDKIAGELAESGATVISGMASGIDAIAARAALNAGNKTIAVLGCGVDRAYPYENAQLMEDIIASGAVISEYPPGAGADGWHFPQRNRIISGLARGVLVTEAPRKSGSLITSSYALEQGKDIFAVPGSIFVKNHEGCNALLSSGAKAVSKASDILEEYTFLLERLQLEKPSLITRLTGRTKKVNNEIKLSVSDKRFSGLSDTEKTIISLLIEENLHIDDIARKSGVPASTLSSTLAILEFGGYISKIPGNNYKLNI